MKKRLKETAGEDPREFARKKRKIKALPFEKTGPPN